MREFALKKAGVLIDYCLQNGVGLETLSFTVRGESQDGGAFFS